ncbi:MAG TPA: fibronectin type III domain-containing protein, partial [Candidatus Polarisedimenticolia bacterium]
MHRSRGFGKLCVTIGLGLILALSAAAPARAATGLKLAWDANTEPDLAGYRIRYGTAPGTRTQMVDVGNFTSYTVTGLTAGTTYYFAVHAYDLSGNESLPSSEVSGTPVALSPILTLSAADAPDPVAAGANLTYTISYANGGTADATGVVITDTVPANTTFVSATLGGTLSGGVVTWNIGTLPISSSGSVQIVVRVASPLANGTTITNGSYSIDSNETSAVAGTVITTGVTAAPILTLSGTDAPDPVNPGGTLTYTLRYANNGNANATGVVLTDPLPANTTFVSATLGGTQAAGLVTWSLGTLNAGTSGSAQLVVTVAAPLANGTTITNASFGIGSNETAAVGGASIATTVLSGNRFALAQTASPNPVLPGGTVTWTLTYQNLWSTGATGVVITDPVPANTSFVSATAGGTLSGSNVSWTVGSLAASASGSVQMTVRVTSPLADGTVITNSLWSIVSNESTLQTGPAATTTVTSSPLLSLSASDAPDPVSAGSNLTYTLTYRNGGTANATGVVIADTLPANTIFVSATSGGTLSGS